MFELIHGIGCRNDMTMHAAGCRDGEGFCGKLVVCETHEHARIMRRDTQCGGFGCRSGDDTVERSMIFWFGWTIGN